MSKFFNNKSQNIIDAFKICFVLFVALLIYWTALRVFLYTNHIQMFSSLTSKLLKVSFLNGVRFDISSIFYTNLIFFILIFSNSIRSSRAFKVIFILSNSILGFMHLLDIEFFGVMGKRIDKTFLSLADETKMTSYSSFFSEYGYTFLGLLVFVTYFYILIKLVEKLIPESNSSYQAKFRSKAFAIYFFILACVAFVSIRGGLQRKPLNVVHAYHGVEGNGRAASLSLNTAYNLIRTKASNPFPKRYRNLSGPFITDRKFENTDINILKKPKNILIIFIESLSTYSVERKKGEYIISRLAKEFPNETIYNKDHFSNGRFSMDALTSVFLGVPSFFDLFLFKSNFAQNKWVGLGTVLKNKADFNTFFIHAAPPGTMYFDKITPAVGITDFYALAGEDRGHPAEMLAPWGVHDELMYTMSQPVINKYAAENKPFMGVLFSVSSHTPFENTPGDTSLRGEKDENYFRSVDYSQKTLEVFLKSIKNEPWFKETLFIVTGDHSPPLNASWLHKPREKSRVPLLMYFPGSNLGTLKVSKQSQHLDLSNSIFDILGVSPEEWSPYGRSIFDTDGRRLIGYYWDKSFNFVEKDCLNVMPVFDENKNSVSPREENAVCKNSLNENKLKEYDSFVKSYVNRLEKNQIYN